MRRGGISLQHSPPQQWQDIFRQGMIGWNHRPPRIVYTLSITPFCTIPAALDLAWSPRRTKKKAVETEKKKRKTYKRTPTLPGKKGWKTNCSVMGARHLFMPLLLQNPMGVVAFGKSNSQCQRLKSVSDTFCHLSQGLNSLYWGWPSHL